MLYLFRHIAYWSSDKSVDFSKSYITTYYTANCDYFRQHIEYP